MTRVFPGASSTSCSTFVGETWNRRSFFRSLGGPLSRADIEGPPALARFSKAALFCRCVCVCVCGGGGGCGKKEAEG